MIRKVNEVDGYSNIKTYDYLGGPQLRAGGYLSTAEIERLCVGKTVAEIKDMFVFDDATLLAISIAAVPTWCNKDMFGDLMNVMYPEKLKFADLASVVRAVRTSPFFTSKYDNEGAFKSILAIKEEYREELQQFLKDSLTPNGKSAYEAVYNKMMESIGGETDEAPVEVVGTSEVITGGNVPNFNLQVLHEDLKKENSATAADFQQFIGENLLPSNEDLILDYFVRIHGSERKVLEMLFARLIHLESLLGEIKKTSRSTASSISDKMMRNEKDETVDTLTYVLERLKKK
jgi:hypothetical protein